MAKATEDHKLTVGDFECPLRFVNDFAADEFEELVELFQKYDADGSRSIDIFEIRELLKDMDLDHTIDQGLELVKELDTDESGVLEFGVRAPPITHTQSLYARLSCITRL